MQVTAAGNQTTRPTVHKIGNQSWTDDNLWVQSYHEAIGYYTSRWDALCPYIEVTSEMLSAAPRPFIVYAIPPESSFGVLINDQYGLANVADPGFWSDQWRARKFHQIKKQYKHFRITREVVSGRTLTLETLFDLGGIHFANFCIDNREVEGLLDYIQDLDILVIKVLDADGTLVLSDVSVLLPEKNQVYGSFCQWNRDYKNKSPGIFACLLVCEWAAENGFSYYNLGPVGDYGYKSIFVTDLEPIYALALCEEGHPLALDRTSPLHTDFKPEDWNRLHRTPKCSPELAG